MREDSTIKQGREWSLPHIFVWILFYFLGSNESDFAESSPLSVLSRRRNNVMPQLIAIVRNITPLAIIISKDLLQAL